MRPYPGQGPRGPSHTSRSAYFGGGGTRQNTGPDTLPDASSKKSAASPFSLIFQSMTPAPGFWLGAAPRACVNLILVPSGRGPRRRRGLQESSPSEAASLAARSPKARTGFEPVFSEEGDEGSIGREPAAGPEPELPAELLRIVQRLTKASQEGSRES
jgi:hypothetical protein